MQSPLSFKLVRDPEKADHNAVCLTIYEVPSGLCAWYIAPASFRIDDGYLPASDGTMASIATLRALAVAERIGTTVCIIDPDNLWSKVWPAR